MATETFLDQMKTFGARLGLPKVDVDKLIDMQLKNIDAFGRSAQVAGEGAKALADKQREIVEAAKGVRAHDAEHTRHRRAGQEDDNRGHDDHSGQIAGELDGAARQRQSLRKREVMLGR
jgi:hypothetical protein